MNREVEEYIRKDLYVFYLESRFYYVGKYYESC